MTAITTDISLFRSLIQKVVKVRVSGAGTGAGLWSARRRRRRLAGLMRMVARRGVARRQDLARAQPEGLMVLAFRPVLEAAQKARVEVFVNLPQQQGVRRQAGVKQVDEGVS